MTKPTGYRSVFRPGLFAGQLVRVTGGGGGGGGIGRCVAHELAPPGARVVFGGRSQAKLDRVAAAVAEDGGTAHTIAFDIRDEEAVKAGVATVIAAHGPVAGLVNNAGGQLHHRRDTADRRRGLAGQRNLPAGRCVEVDAMRWLAPRGHARRAEVMPALATCLDPGSAAFQATALGMAQRLPALCLHIVHEAGQRMLRPDTFGVARS